MRLENILTAIRSRPARSGKPNAVPTILLYNSAYIRTVEALDGCRLSRDRARLHEADVVVFHIPTLEQGFSLRKPPGQRWIAWSMESQVNYPRLADPDFMRRFDYTMTYRLDSDFPTLYVGPSLLTNLGRPPQDKTEAAPAVYVASSPYNQSGRNEYVRELMRHLQVDSYGRVLHNRSLPEDRGRETKLATIARYRFTLAFENSITDDYVTEKFFDPLVAGSVPVYRGASNVQCFAPGDHCYINVADCRDPAELAEYLLHLCAHPAQYAEYLTWKDRDLRPQFLRLVETQRRPALCRLCSALVRGDKGERLTVP
jgi:hypothetical protein